MKDSVGTYSDRVFLLLKLLELITANINIQAYALPLATKYI